MKKNIVITIIMAVVLACNLYGDEELGNGYYLWRDGQYREIVYNPNYKQGEGGYSLMHKNVVLCCFDDSIIYAKTRGIVDGEVINEFFIIKKETISYNELKGYGNMDSLFRSIITQVEDSIRFKKLLLEKGLHLK